MQEIVVRTNVAPAALIDTVRATIDRVDPEVATKLTTYESRSSHAVATPRFRAWLVGTFAGLALLAGGCRHLRPDDVSDGTTHA